MDSANHFVVVRSGETVGVHAATFSFGRKGSRTRVPHSNLSVDKALNLAAWIVAITTEIDPANGATFEALLEEITK